MSKTHNMIRTVCDVMEIINEPDKPRKMTPRQRALEIAAASMRLAMALGEEKQQK